jgi:hypothetical protein
MVEKGFVGCGFSRAKKNIKIFPQSLINQTRGVAGSVKSPVEGLSGAVRRRFQRSSPGTAGSPEEGSCPSPAAPY